jgi:hypothetical protein
MKFRINRKSLERLRALVRAGDFDDIAWSWTVADSNTLLGDDNWTNYQLSFLGIGIGVPTDGSTDITITPSKDDYAYPFMKGERANLQALREIAKKADAARDLDVADMARACLQMALEKVKDQQMASGKACDREIKFTAATALIIAKSVGKTLPTVTADVYTGGPMELDGWTHPVVIDLEGLDTTQNPRPILKDHDPKMPLGHTTSWDIATSMLKATGVISAAGQHVDDVLDSARKGFPFQVSIGAKVLRSEFIPEGATAQANGKTWSGPVNIARRTSAREISLLSLGADDNTSASIAAKAAQKGAKMALKKKFAAWARGRNITMADMEDDGMSSAAKALYKAQMKCEADDPEDEDDDGEDSGKKKSESGAKEPEIKAGAGTGSGANGNAGSDAVKEIRAAALGERQRLGRISAALDEYRPRVAAEKFAEIEAKAIGGELNIEQTELALIKAARPVMTAPNINTGKGGAPDGNIVAAAAAISMGISEKAAFKGLDERGGNIAASMRGLTLHSILAMCAGRLGMHLSAGGVNDDFLGDFLRKDRESYRQQITAHRQALAAQGIQASSSAGFSTMSLSGITENILYKSMLEMYGLQPSVAPEICNYRDTNDFKPYKVYRLTASGDFEPVGPGGEIKNFSLQDESYANAVTTKAALLVLKREDLINDDMGALMQSSQVMGRKAALNFEKTVLATFLLGLSTVAPGASVGKAANGFNFFSTGAANLQTGAGSALSIASVQTARQKFLQQKDANGDPIMVMPDRLLVGPELEGVADNLFNGANLTVQALQLPTSGAQSASQTVNLNQHKGKYRPIVTPYLGGASPIAGATATQWAMLCNPAGGMATVQAGFLRGQRTPIIRQVEVDASMLGLAFQGIFDFGISLLDYRCGQYSAGA